MGPAPRETRKMVVHTRARFLGRALGGQSERPQKLSLWPFVPREQDHVAHKLSPVDRDPMAALCGFLRPDDKGRRCRGQREPRQGRKRDTLVALGMEGRQLTLPLHRFPRAGLHWGCRNRFHSCFGNTKEHLPVCHQLELRSPHCPFPCAH